MVSAEVPGRRCFGHSPTRLLEFSSCPATGYRTAELGTSSLGSEEDVRSGPGVRTRVDGMNARMYWLRHQSELKLAREEGVAIRQQPMNGGGREEYSQLNSP